MRRNKNKQSGFTLIELLVVISILGLISSIVLSSLRVSRVKSRDAQRLQETQAIAKALDLYYDNNGHYPPNSNATATYMASWGAFKTALAPYYAAPNKAPGNVWPYNHYIVMAVDSNYPGTFWGISSGGNCRTSRNGYLIYSYLENPTGSIANDGGVAPFYYEKYGGDVKACPTSGPWW